MKNPHGEEEEERAEAAREVKAGFTEREGDEAERSRRVGSGTLSSPGAGLEGPAEGEPVGEDMGEGEADVDRLELRVVREDIQKHRRRREGRQEEESTSQVKMEKKEKNQEVGRGGTTEGRRTTKRGIDVEERKRKNKTSIGFGKL